ncbi:MAG: hypothetical protein GIW99_10975 [Candidatus Eremiobacteraeota bacterium]|nr:hypothetical protein [Candidatus Eremiobacteraeota bacterium]MBC5828183.1 hypothetical protein [Candidatus Eremiobacteraeota bacterium]
MRFARVVWPVVFLVPLVPLAGKLCSFLPTDFIYHSLVWVHERLPWLALVAALLAVVGALVRYVKLRGQIQALMTLSTEAPQSLARIFADEARQLAVPAPRLAYVDVSSRFCLTAVSGPTVLISSGFADPLPEDKLRLVARHELIHVRRRDPERSLLWHLFFSALLVPGFEGLERWLYERRERKTDEAASKSDAAGYAALLKECSASTDDVAATGGFLCSTAPNLERSDSRPARASTVSFRHLLPSAVALVVITGLIASHEAFTNHLPYLLAHHC